MEIINEVYKTTGDRETTREIIEQMKLGNEDIFAGGFSWRVVAEHNLASVMADELESDAYMVGCFAPWAIGDVLEMPAQDVEALQRAGHHEILGRMILKDRHLVEALVEIASSYDGWGHHFSSYDGREEIVSYWDDKTNSRRYFSVFRLN